MAGRLVLTTPWSREGVIPIDRKIIEAAIPDGYQVNVSVSADRRWWLLWFHGPDHPPPDAALKVSRVLSLRQSVTWALKERWKVGDA